MIFYFSATGNTRWAARFLAEATGESLIDMAQTETLATDYTLREGERIGFVWPVHGWRIPKIVDFFISHRLHIRNAQGHYCYSVCTAGDTVALAMDYLQKALSKQGLKIHSAFSLIMPEAYVGLPLMDVDTLEKEKEKKTTAKASLAEIAEDVKLRRKDIFRLIKGPLPWLFSVPIGGFFARYLITDKPFHADRNKCTACGRCAKVCPVGDISYDDKGLPQWNHNTRCLTCFSCYHHCPAKAIAYGNRTKHKGQYYFERNK